MATPQNENIKQLIQQEYLKCAQDPVYFLIKYVYIQTSKGRMLFNPYVFQKKLLHLLKKNDRAVILKSRQLGITTLTAAYALWLMIFRKDQSILALAPTQDKAKNIVEKVRFAYAELPSWLKVAAVEDNKLSLVLTNGSKIRAASGASDSARGITANVLILDEAAFIDNAEELWGSAQQTLATGGIAIVLSTPNGRDGFFDKMYTEAESGANNFLPIRLPWNVHPDRDQKWRDDQDRELGKRMAAQECDCSFLTSGNTFFEIEDLEYLLERVEDPIEMNGPEKNFWIWEYPINHKTYEVVVDTSRGDGTDFSTIQVIEVSSGDQVAEYRGNMDTKSLARLAVATSVQYNNALLIIENTGLGHATMSDVLELNYNNIYYSPKADTLNVSQYLSQMYEYDTSRMTPGFTTSVKTRPEVLQTMKQYVRGRLIKIRSKRTVNEMQTFVWKNGKAQAQNGCNDDLVIPYAIGLYLRESALQYVSKGVDLQRAVINSISRKSSYSNEYFRNNVPKDNPFLMGVNGQKEDISWLVT